MSIIANKIWNIRRLIQRWLRGPCIEPEADRGRPGCDKISL